MVQKGLNIEFLDQKMHNTQKKGCFFSGIPSLDISCSVFKVSMPWLLLIVVSSHTWAQQDSEAQVTGPETQAGSSWGVPWDPFSQQVSLGDMFAQLLSLFFTLPKWAKKCMWKKCSKHLGTPLQRAMPLYGNNTFQREKRAFLTNLFQIGISHQLKWLKHVSSTFINIYVKPVKLHIRGWSDPGEEKTACSSLAERLTHFWRSHLGSNRFC